MEAIKPQHYQTKVVNRKNGKSVKCDYFDIGNALNLSLEWFTALRYSLIKGDVDKQINDTKKAIECLHSHIDNLKQQKKKKKKLF